MAETPRPLTEQLAELLELAELTPGAGPLIAALFAVPCRLLTAEHAAELLDTSVKSVRRLLTNGDLRIVRLSRQQVRIRADDLAAFIDGHTEDGNHAHLPGADRGDE